MSIPSEFLPVIQQPEPQNVAANFDTVAGFELLQRAAKLLAASKLVPEAFRGQVADCVIALEIANRIGVSPMMILQNLYIVYGKPGFSAQFLIAMINASRKFSPLRYEMTGEGDERTCVAWAVEKLTGDKLPSPPVSIKMAKDEGWYARNGSKWKTLPELMLRYRAATFFARLYCPEITMGMQTAEELGDTYDGEAVRTTASDIDQAIMGEPITAVAESPPKPDAKIGSTVPTWPKRTDQGYVDSAGELYNEERHAAIPRGQTVPTVNSDGTFRRRRGAEGTAKSQQPAVVSKAEEQAMAILAAAVDIETCDEAEFEVKNEPPEVQSRVHEAAEARRRELSANA